MTRWTRVAATLLAVATASHWLGCGEDASSSGGGEKHCVRSATSCRCSREVITLDASETEVADCDAPPSGSSCCYDVDANGKTTECICGTFACAPSDTDCDCHWWDKELPADAIDASECTYAAAAGVAFPLPGICCDRGQSCGCTGAQSPSSTQTCASGDERTSCSGPSEPRDCSYFGDDNRVGQAPASSCAGLAW